MARDSYHHFTSSPRPGAPVVFTFHGTGGDEHQFAELIAHLLPGAGIVAPRGDVLERGAHRFFRRLAEGVYDMDDLLARTGKMAGFIRAHRELHEGSRFFAIGYSNGANILASVLLQHPELFERVALMHPLVPWQPEPNPALQSLDILITAGRRDPICPLPLTEALARYFTDQGATVQLELHDGGHEIRPEEVQALAGFLRR